MNKRRKLKKELLFSETNISILESTDLDTLTNVLTAPAFQGESLLFTTSLACRVLQLTVLISFGHVRSPISSYTCESS